MNLSNDLSIPGQVQLMGLIIRRRTAEIALLVVPWLLFWVHMKEAGPSEALMGWAVALLVVLVLIAWFRGRYFDDEARLDPATLLVRWRPRVVLYSSAYGLVWTVPIPLTLGEPSLLFSTMLYLSLCGITAGAASFLAAVPAAFVGFMIGIWAVAGTAIPSMFPQSWPIVLPAAAVFCAVTLTHGLATHRFLSRQIRLEEHSKTLMEQYRLARDEATRALGEKNLFLSTASHDLRQPVHAMSMLVEAIRLRNRDDALEGLLMDLRRSMGSVRLMFDALLDLNRFESGATSLRPSPVVLGELVREVADLFRQEAMHRGLSLRCHVPRRDVVVVTDPALVRQILVNLVHNALRYTRKGGILMAIRQRRGHCGLEVWDTGIGLPREQDERIFSPYVRAPQADQFDDAGHGLGLAVVARCARLLKAEVGYGSRPGKGSVFWLRLGEAASRDVPVPAPLTMPALVPAVPAQLQGRCLVLDDDPQVLSAWHNLLESWGIDGRYADSAAQARGLLAAGFVPDVIFCDQRLGDGESGFDVLRELLEQCPQATGAMISGELASASLAEADRQGYPVLRKPVDAGELLAVLSTWLAGKRR